MEVLRMEDYRNVVLFGDVLERLAEVPDGAVQCVVTSPPYWGLRDYGVAGQIGLEATIEEYVAKMVAVFREVRRVLRDDGTLWLNLGDSYANRGCDSSTVGGFTGERIRAGKKGIMDSRPREIPTGLKPKDLCMIPARVALALQADGWWLRQDNIWSKPNPMPESCSDRTTTAHEHMFHLSKRARYFYDADAIREEHKPESLVIYEYGAHSSAPKGGMIAAGSDTGIFNCERKGNHVNPAGRNKRSVWTIPTQPYSGAHFATFPERLVEPCILAGTSPQACPGCGAPWRRVVEKQSGFDADGNCLGCGRPKAQPGKSNMINRRGEAVPCGHGVATGWQATCPCEGNDGSGRCIVMDPFAGSGTVGAVALKTGRDYLLIELNEDYEGLIRERLGLFYKRAA